MKIGIIQQHNGEDVKTNVLHLATKIRQLAKAGAAPPRLHWCR